MSERAATATRPFEFTGCVVFREILGRRARVSSVEGCAYWTRHLRSLLARLVS
jgi:hypothetical protein